MGNWTWGVPNFCSNTCFQKNTEIEVVIEMVSAVSCLWDYLLRIASLEWTKLKNWSHLSKPRISLILKDCRCKGSQLRMPIDAILSSVIKGGNGTSPVNGKSSNFRSHLTLQREQIREAAACHGAMFLATWQFSMETDGFYSMEWGSLFPDKPMWRPHSTWTVRIECVVLRETFS